LGTYLINNLFIFFLIIFIFFLVKGYLNFLLLLSKAFSPPSNQKRRKGGLFLMKAMFERSSTPQGEGIVV